jgi:hypothetical protein
MRTDESDAIVKELVSGSHKLYLFFGGMAGGLGIPQFEFMRFSRSIEENKIFVRDMSQYWYQTGASGNRKNIYELRDYLRKQIDEINPQDVYFIGNSMGGYAAILFGCMLDVGEIHAFSPQTFISPYNRFYAKDFRWSRQVLSTYYKSLFRPHIYDLRKCMPLKRNRLINIYVSNADKLDCKHANHISNYPYVKVHVYEKGGHELVSHLRDTGKLAEIFSQ